LGGILPQKQRQQHALIAFQQAWIGANDRAEAVQGCADSCITGAVRGPEHRRRGGKMPAGSRRWIAAIAKQYMDVLSEQPGAGEKHRGFCRARSAAKHRVRRLAFLVTFWAMPKSNRLAEGETKLCTSRDKREEKINSCLRGNEGRRKELDSGLTSSAVESRRNDELKEKSEARARRYSATARDCIPR
jgi:hypothetical protein